MTNQNTVSQGWSYKATVLRRFAAVIIDALLIIPVVILLGVIAEATKQNWIIQLSYLFYYFYSVFFVWKYGATLGKRWLHIKVVNKEGKNPTLIQAFLREVIGKIISSLVFDLGYLWAFWDKDRQTWHDKIAGTYVMTDIPNDGKKSGCLIALVFGIVILIPIIAILVVVGLTTFSGLQKNARDAKRVAELTAVEKAMANFTQDNPDANLCGQNPVPCIRTSKLNPNDWLPVPVEFVGKKLPVDPINDNVYTYTYCSDGKYWEVDAKMESSTYANKAQRDNSDRSDLYEIGTNLTLCPLTPARKH